MLPSYILQKSMCEQTVNYRGPCKHVQDAGFNTIIFSLDIFHQHIFPIMVHVLINYLRILHESNESNERSKMFILQNLTSISHVFLSKGRQDGSHFLVNSFRIPKYLLLLCIIITLKLLMQCVCVGVWGCDGEKKRLIFRMGKTHFSDLYGAGGSGLDFRGQRY